jgi:hypothetical protein
MDLVMVNRRFHRDTRPVGAYLDLLDLLDTTR